MFDGLRDVDDVEMRGVEEDVVLREICVDEFARMVEAADDYDHFDVECGEGGGGDVCVFQAR